MNNKKENDTILSKKNKELKIIEAIKTVFDPEIPVNIYDLGLIYDISIDEKTNYVEVEMTLTSPSCPVAESLPIEVEDTIKKLDFVSDVKIMIVFEPSWNKDMMSDEARLDLGFM